MRRPAWWPVSWRQYRTDMERSNRAAREWRARAEHAEGDTEAALIVEAVRDMHSPYPQNTGSAVDAYGHWYCKACRTAWPCKTFAATETDVEYEGPLKLERRRVKP